LDLLEDYIHMTTSSDF